MVVDLSFRKHYCLWERFLSKFSSVILYLRSWSRRERLCFLYTIALIVAEAASISLCTLSFCFPLIALSHSALNADMLPFLTFDQHNTLVLILSFLALELRVLIV